MRVDIFKREEQNSFYSYLLVLEGKNIPNEATNINWELHKKSIDIDLDEESIDSLSIIYPSKQIKNKGYAISYLSQLRNN